MTETQREFKIILVGDRGTGKTTFIKRFTTKYIEPKYMPTHGILVNPITFNTNKGDILMNVWDPAFSVRLSKYF